MSTPSGKHDTPTPTTTTAQAPATQLSSGASRVAVRRGDDALRRLLDAAPEGSALFGVTAARRYGLTLPEQLDADQRVHVVVRASKRIRRRGVVEHRGVGPRRIRRVDGLAMTGLGDTWCDLAGLVSETDLVVMGDEIANRAGVVELQRAVARRGNGRHVRLMRRALVCVRRGSDSPMETRARLAFAAGGLPEPELNAPIRDSHGQWLARVDFLWREARLIVEYQSEFHADKRRREADEARRRQLEAAGYRVIFITASTILRESARDELCRELLAAGRRAGCAW